MKRFDNEKGRINLYLNKSNCFQLLILQHFHEENEFLDLQIQKIPNFLLQKLMHLHLNLLLSLHYRVNEKELFCKNIQILLNHTLFFLNFNFNTCIQLTPLRLKECHYQPLNLIFFFLQYHHKQIQC